MHIACYSSYRMHNLKPNKEINYSIVRSFKLSEKKSQAVVFVLRRAIRLTVVNQWKCLCHHEQRLTAADIIITMTTRLPGNWF